MKNIRFNLSLGSAAAALMLTAPAMALDHHGAAKHTEQNTETKEAKPQLGNFGFDVDGMNSEVRPGDDFYEYANGKWAKETVIPDDKANYGMFTALDDLSKKRVREILNAELEGGDSKVGAAYASYLDSETVEAKGMAPIAPIIDEISNISDDKGYEAFMIKNAAYGIAQPFFGYVGQDDKDPETYIFNIYQAGTGLPDRDMYLVENEKLSKIRTSYLEYLTKTLELAGQENAAERAAAIFEMEKKIAEKHWTREDSSDSTKTYNKMSVDELNDATPGMDMKKILMGISPKIDHVIVAQPSAIAAIAQIMSSTNIEVRKDQLIVSLLQTYGGVLPDAVADNNFAFYGTALSGTPKREERWKRAVSFAENALGEELGQLYVAKYFPPATKASMDVLVKNVLAAMGRRIDGLSWMQSETKTKAKKKLDNFTTKIGYPDKWKDYSALEIKSDDLFGNQLRIMKFNFDDNISKLGTPIRRHEWGMLPQTVNAYANFGMNEIVFPAAILQPPFFDPNADPAINYGGIGAVIGHEISHHFDDQGSKYDETGKLSDWWTPEDVAAFEAAGKNLIAQYDKYEALPGEFVKGEFTLGENIGDLAGLTIAYDAYRASLNGKEAPVIDGFTGDQRFFLGWAQVWRRNYREANLSQRLLTDSHSPSIQRAWVVRNLDKFYDAFKPEKSEKLYLEPEARVKIW
ncbi:peptidase M13 [Sphingorhabdus lutea]|uniref:Peptidase M13 n=1 Tax=Sphingorhabdus lutea TaxID=1913578 RepID=A0A1L3JCL8_9SPHN|nr:M13 family metallopeptidase [Sphingorhabdus lutea]APG62839.1 peptidase M13 [Sphingorhabdus lutea]